VDTARDHADPGYPSQAAACPTADLHDLPSDTADAGTDGHRTPTLNAGRLDAQMSASDTGLRSRGRARVDTGRSHQTPDAGHRTLAEDVDTVTIIDPFTLG
jgi:hypothetical protein